MITVLPSAIADQMDDATPACDAASDAEVNAFLGRHIEAARPEILDGWVKALENHFAEHASRHGSTLTVLVGALKEARAGYFPAYDAINTIRPMFIGEVAKPPASSKQNAARTGKTAESEFNGILAWSVGQADAADLAEVHARVELQMPDNLAWMNNITGNGQAGPAPVAAPKHRAVLSVEHLEQDFWEPDELRQIYDDALGRMLSPWAVLTHCVARVLTRVRPCVVLPPIIGYGSLNWFGAVVSISGGGKSAAETLAVELVPGMPTHVRNLGSGEGVAAQYWTQGTKKNPATRIESVMFYADEVDCVAALAKRQGANLMSVVRTGFSGGTLGFSYTKGNDKHVDAGTYRMTLVLSMQPERSGWLFDDAEGGTPQRLMWFPGDDPRINDSIPERGKVIKLPIPNLNTNNWQTYRRELKIPGEARRLIRSERAKSGRGEKAALDGHALFSREKYAFGLTLLQGRTEMSSADWRRAGIAAEVSSYTRDWTQQVEKTSGVTRATADGALRGVAQEAADDERIKRRVLRWALRTLDAAPGKRMKYRDLQNKQTSRDHPWLLAALALGASNGLVAVTADGEWKLP